LVSSPLLYLLVSISGAAVLALEILGTRWLGPFYGVSLYLWSALITVTLAALSAGYALGGRWADRGPRLFRLGLVLGGAGLWTLLVPWMRGPLLHLTEAMGLRAAVLTAAVVLFAPPLLLLGMVSPYALRLKATEVAHVGTDAGNLFAVSTVASVLSALAVGFWLIPALGVSRLTLVVGAFLLLGSAVALVQGSRGAGAAAAAALLAAVGLAVFLPVEEAPGVVYHADSPYGEVKVLQRPEGTYLLLDGGVHTLAGFGVGEGLIRYVPVFSSLQLLFEEPGRMLLIGLGGGVVAQDYAAEGWEVDAVEIDPAVVEAARDHFGLSRDVARIHVEDGRRFLRETTERWDLVLVDAFGSASIPFHLVTSEFFSLARQRVAPHGLLAMNVETRGWDDPLVAALARTLQESFSTVLALPTQEPPNSLGNVVLVASADPDFRMEGFVDRLPRPVEHLGDDYDHWRVVQMNHAWDNRFVPETRTAVVLTDDRNPVALWAEAVNREAREELREYFADDPAVY